MALYRMTRHSALLCFSSILALATGCSSSSPTSGTSLETRATIEGRVVLVSGVGLSDLSRVSVDLGRGEGGVPVADDGTFRFSDVEPDVYTLVVTYAGGLTPDAAGSAYQRYEVRVTAAAGSVTNLGNLELLLGHGSVTGTLQPPAGVTAGQILVELTGATNFEVRPESSGAFTLSSIPVGAYVLTATVDGANASACIEADVVVAYDGHVVDIGTVTAQDTAVVLEPIGADLSGNVYYGRSATLQVMTTAPFATDARIWTGSAAGEFLPFVSPMQLSISGLQEALNRIYVQFKNSCGLESGIYELDVIVDSTPPTLNGPTAEAFVIQNGAAGEVRVENAGRRALADLRQQLHLRAPPRRRPEDRARALPRRGRQPARGRERRYLPRHDVAVGTTAANTQTGDR